MVRPAEGGDAVLTTLAISLLLTLLLEEAFALLWGLRGRRELALVALVNCLTNPPVVLLYYALSLPVLLLEAAAVLVEWRCYRTFSDQLRRPFLFALLANVLSYTVGYLINF